MKMKAEPMNAVLAKVMEICPAAVQNGKINFERLRQELGDAIDNDINESYNFTWVGKREAIREANSSINKTLRPYKEESKNWDTTENLYIEGDNLDALKLLQESYLGKVKMIYIDPPYNTGKDFIYKDNFKKDKTEYLLDLGIDDEDTGERLFCNTETNGRFHSDWCSMLYPRLKLARDFLTDDGVIFISIDDNEVANLRKICDEIFGEGNFIKYLVWESGKPFGFKATTTTWPRCHEYVLHYAKNINNMTYIPTYTIENSSNGEPIMTSSIIKAKENGIYSMDWVQGAKESVGFGSGQKPIKLIHKLLNNATYPNNDIILDFFSGSATTAHAVMQLNAEDGGKRRFIMVQLPEPCKDGEYKNICEIGKERIRRAGEKIITDAGLINKELDIGFRVLKVDDSNMKDVYYTPSELNKESLSVDNIKKDRSPLDLLFGVMIDWGMSLSSPIIEKKIGENTVFIVGDDALVACFDKEISEDVFCEIAKMNSIRAVFRDASFKDDSAKINVFEIFKSIGLAPEIKVI